MAKLINDVRAHTNNIKPGSGDKNNIRNDKVKKESTTKRMKKIISDLKQLRQKKR